MHNICRLCLSVCPQVARNISVDSEFLDKIQSCLLVEVAVNEFLPTQVCDKCVEKLEEVQTFQNKVNGNQNILLHFLSIGKEKLIDFYSTLKSQSDKSDIELLSDNEKKYLHISGIARNFMDNTIDGEEFIVKEEIGIDFEAENITEYDSEDETLSSIKSAKCGNEKNTNKTLEDSIKWSKENINSSNTSGTLISETDIKTYSPILNDLNHKCLTCFAVFNTQSDLLDHYNIEHGHKIPDISKDTNVNKDLDNSENTNDSKVTGSEICCMFENGTQVYKCRKCDRVMDNKKAVNRHLITHVEDRPFICKICGRTYKTASEIVRHGRAHSGLKINCSYQCGYSTVYVGALKEHEKRHRTEFKYKCETCNRGFQVKTWYEEHQNIHNGVKPFVCNICGLAFHMNRYLTAHRSTVHPQSSSLKRYVCMHCSFPCDSRNAFTEHLKEHGIKTSFLCDICGKTLTNAEQLKLHKRVHLGERPYNCSTCNKSFAKKFNLTLHERTHSGQRAHACPRCSKRYSQRSTLLRHHKRHHADSPQKCSKCEKSFTCLSQLSNHERICM